MINYEEQEELTQQDSQSDLDLNTEIVHNRKETYTSLSDLYGIQLFTDQRMEENRQYQEKIEQKEKGVTESIFINKTFMQNVDQQTINKLFAEPLSITKNQDYTNNTMAKNGFFIAGSIIIIGVFIAMTARYFKKRKQMRNMEENSCEQ